MKLHWFIWVLSFGTNLGLLWLNRRVMKENERLFQKALDLRKEVYGFQLEKDLARRNPKPGYSNGGYYGPG